MGKLHHLLWVLLIVLGVALPTNAFAICWWDCDKLDSSTARMVANDYVRTGGNGSFKALAEEYADNTHCDQCYNNLNELLKQFKWEKAIQCMQYRSCDGNLDCACINEWKDEDKEWRERAIAGEGGSGLCYEATVYFRSSTGQSIANKYSKILEVFLKFGGTGCWFCPIFDTIFDTTNTIATTLYNRLRGVFLSLLALGAFGWLLWTVFKFITTIHGPNVGELMTTLFKGLGLVMLVSIILMAKPSFITGIVVDPIAGIASALSSDILAVRNFGGEGNNTIKYNKYIHNACFTESFSTHQREVRVCQDADRSRFTDKALSADVYNGMNCLLRRMSLELVFGMALGSAILAHSFSGGTAIFFGRLDIFLVGCIVLLSYLALFIMVPFKLIDLVLRLCFVIILLPLFLVCFVFPATRGYTKKGWDLFLSCWVTLIALSLLITFAIELINTALL